MTTRCPNSSRLTSLRRPRSSSKQEFSQPRQVWSGALSAGNRSPGSPAIYASGSRAHPPSRDRYGAERCCPGTAARRSSAIYARGSRANPPSRDRYGAVRSRAGTAARGRQRSTQADRAPTHPAATGMERCALALLGCHPVSDAVAAGPLKTARSCSDMNVVGGCGLRAASGSSRTPAMGARRPDQRCPLRLTHTDDASATTLVRADGLRPNASFRSRL
jgi:hypothetical protein